MVLVWAQGSTETVATFVISSEQGARSLSGILFRHLFMSTSKEAFLLYNINNGDVCGQQPIAFPDYLASAKLELCSTTTKR